MPRLALLLFALLTVAVRADEHSRPSFTVTDTDHDERVSFAEFRTAMLKHIEKRARQGQGRARNLSPERRERGIRWVFTELDRNGDQLLDAAEWDAGVEQGKKSRQ